MFIFALLWRMSLIQAKVKVRKRESLFSHPKQMCLMHLLMSKKRFPGPSSLDPCHCNMRPIFSYSFIPEDQQKQDMSPLTYSTDSDALPASSSPSAVSSDSDVSSLETTQDYIQLWPKTSDPQSQIKYEVKSWPCTVQDQSNGTEVYQPFLLCPLTQARGSAQKLGPFPIRHTSWAYALCMKSKLQISISVREVIHMLVVLTAE